MTEEVPDFALEGAHPGHARSSAWGSPKTSPTPPSTWRATRAGFVTGQWLSPNGRPGSSVRPTDRVLATSCLAHEDRRPGAPRTASPWRRWGWSWRTGRAGSTDALVGLLRGAGARRRRAHRHREHGRHVPLRRQLGARARRLGATTFLPGLRRLTEAVHRHGAKIALQLAHHGKVGRLDTNQGRDLVLPSKPKREDGPLRVPSTSPSKR